MKYLLKSALVVTISLLSLNSCSKKEKSSTTGWAYNDQKNGGFEKLKYEGQATGPNLVLIQGGTFSMGLTEEDVTHEWNNVARRITVTSFYLDETEVRNIDYREYLYWLERVYTSYPEVYKKALPDTLVWREELAFNEPYVETYFRHPAYDDYPVVGVNWNQANDFCKWRTDRVNEMVLQERGILYAPDFLINAGGIINVYAELAHYGKAEIMAKTENIYNTTLEIFDFAIANKMTTHQAALTIAQQRIAERKLANSK